MWKLYAANVYGQGRKTPAGAEALEQLIVQMRGLDMGQVRVDIAAQANRGLQYLAAPTIRSTLKSDAPANGMAEGQHPTPMRK